jgi:HAD superfamily hydrolase (TIGR01509 family)
MKTGLSDSWHPTPDSNLGVLWDLDGVLVDSAEAHYQAWVETCAKYAFPFGRATFQRTFGMNNAGIIATLAKRQVTPELDGEISDYKEEVFRRAIRGHVRLFPGVKLWLERFQEAGIPQAVASSAPQANIAVIVDELSIRSCFAALVSGAEMPGKPNPAVFLEAARRIGISPERCLVIEDSVAGVEAARRGGMKCLAVTTSNPRPLLGNAQLILDTLESLSWESIQALLRE